MKGNLIGCKCHDKCLDIGCGIRPFADFADGFDKSINGQKYIGDIERKWPIEDNIYDTIHAWNILEHIRDKIFVLNEAQRVLKPGGTIEIIVPDASKKMELAMADPTHISLWVKGTFMEYFCGRRPGNADYGMKKWELVECRAYTEINDNLIFCIMRKPK